MERDKLHFIFGDPCIIWIGNWVHIYGIVNELWQERDFLYMENGEFSRNCFKIFTVMFKIIYMFLV